MKKLTTDQSKIDLVSRLVKEGHIDFAEALKLIEVEVEEKIVYKEDPFKFPLRRLDGVGLPPWPNPLDKYKYDRPGIDNDKYKITMQS